MDELPPIAAGQTGLATIVGEAVVMAAVHGALLGLLGTGGLALCVAGCGSYVIAVRWVDPGRLEPRDVFAVLGVHAGLMLVPVALLAGVGDWCLVEMMAFVGIGLSQAQLLPLGPEPDQVGVEAHLQHIREHGVERPAGDARRARVSPRLDPLGDLFGNASAPAVPDDPYRDGRAVHIDPERDL